MIKSLTIKEISIYLSLAGSILLWVYNFGGKNAVKDVNTVDLTEKVTRLEKNMDIFSADQQSLILTVGNFQKRFDNYVMKQDQLSGSIKSLALKVAESPLEFARIMEGKTFEVVQDEPMKSIFPSPKIRITPIK